MHHEIVNQAIDAPMLPILKTTSPDGRFQVRVDQWEARNSLWVESPEIWDTIENKTLFRFKSELWSIDRSEWLTEVLVSLTLRKYPGNHLPVDLGVVLDCEKQNASIRSLVVDLQELEALMEQRVLWR